jgi:hypothetical protein
MIGGVAMFVISGVLDSTRLSADQTVEAILADLDTSRVRLPRAASADAHVRCADRGPRG